MTAGVKLRDRRRPGHCWQDNELYDAFQPIIGPHAVLVYVHLTRDCYTGKVDYSIRDLADATGLSRMGVWRNLLVLEHVGILRLQKGRGSAASSCELLDLKDAAERLGGVYNRRQASFVFTDSLTAKLRLEVTELRKNMQKKPAKDDSVCVPQSDANVRKSVVVPIRESDTSVTLEGDLCHSDGGSHQYSEQDTILNTNPSPTPSLQEGAAVSAGPHIDDALEHVMRECGFTDPRLKKALRSPLLLWKSRNTGLAYDAARAMIEAWREYQQVAELLRIHWGPRKFFTQGHWLKPDSWPVDRVKSLRHSDARIGIR